MTGLPVYITITFLLTVALTWLLLLGAARKKTIPFIITAAWLAVIGILAYNAFFIDTDKMPPKLALAVVPAIFFIIGLLFTKKGWVFCNSLDLRLLTLLHVVRLPVELVLYWLALHKAVPELMTFEGRNFDILSGISAPIILFSCFNGTAIKNRRLLLTWNFICLGLVAARRPCQRTMPGGGDTGRGK